MTSGQIELITFILTLVIALEAVLVLLAVIINPLRKQRARREKEKQTIINLINNLEKHKVLRMPWHPDTSPAKDFEYALRSIEVIRKILDNVIDQLNPISESPPILQQMRDVCAEVQHAAIELYIMTAQHSRGDPHITQKDLNTAKKNLKNAYGEFQRTLLDDVDRLRDAYNLPTSQLAQELGGDNRSFMPSAF